jgi:hypothetical protein
MQVDSIGPVGDETSICDETAQKVDRRQLTGILVNLGKPFHHP